MPRVFCIEANMSLLACFRYHISVSSQIPRGNLFSLVACANYFWEVNAWVVFSIMTQVSAAYLFTFISTAQIAQWAIKKHVALKKEFGKANTPRYALFPYVF